jgi:hypothetical protein
MSVILLSTGKSRKNPGRIPEVLDIMVVVTWEMAGVSVFQLGGFLVVLCPKIGYRSAGGN